MPRLGSVQPDSGRAFGSVEVRQANAPKQGWTAEQAIDLLRQGYAVKHVAERTGFDVRWLSVRAAELD